MTWTLLKDSEITKGPSIKTQVGENGVIYNYWVALRHYLIRKTDRYIFSCINCFSQFPQRNVSTSLIYQWCTIQMFMFNSLFLIKSNKNTCCTRWTVNEHIKGKKLKFFFHISDDTCDSRKLEINIFLSHSIGKAAIICVTNRIYKLQGKDAYSIGRRVLTINIMGGGGGGVTLLCNNFLTVNIRVSKFLTFPNMTRDLLYQESML